MAFVLAGAFADPEELGGCGGVAEHKVVTGGESAAILERKGKERMLGIDGVK